MLPEGAPPTACDAVWQEAIDKYRKAYATFDAQRSTPRPPLTRSAAAGSTIGAIHLRPGTEGQVAFPWEVTSRSEVTLLYIL